ncbi:MAG: polysaccharide biosynthesis C-terminal domain-containing protein [Saprospiraceae bacterium]
MANGEKYIPYKNIVFILGISSLLDMVTSINTHIIAYSRHFRFAFYVIIVLAGLNIIFNYLLIKTFGLGITGAALATMLSVFIFNLAKFFFIYWKFGLQPFTLRTLWVVLIGAGVFALASLLPSLGIALIDILYKSFIITILYITPILYFKLSTDLNDFLSKFWMMTRKRLNF